MESLYGAAAPGAPGNTLARALRLLAPSSPRRDIPTPADATAHIATSHERIEHAIAHIAASLRERYDGKAVLDVDVIGLRPEEQRDVYEALRQRGWMVLWTYGAWPARFSTKATVRPLRKVGE